MLLPTTNATSTTTSITVATPPRPSENANANAYRLLYRGALSLPDSHLVLDGVTFSARLDTPSKNSHLLENPLALALESMRGRPTLRLMGVVSLKDDHVWLDESGGVELDVHPMALLTRMYFENMFCLTPFASTSKSALSNQVVETSPVGVKVALGEIDGPDTTQIIIYAKTNRAALNHAQKTVDLGVARIVPRPLIAPKPPAPRLPRPDDPTPRKPPLILFGAGKKELKRVRSMGPNAPVRDLKRAASSSDLVVNSKRTKLTGGIERDNALFKVPELPSLAHTKTSAKGKKKQIQEEDVFGGTNVFQTGQATAGKSKVDEAGMPPGEDIVEMERANKNIIKRYALDYLYKAKDPTVARANKSQPEFKELFGWIYRGVGYALRAQMKIQPIDRKCVERLVKVHVDMYVGGHGGNAAVEAS